MKYLGGKQRLGKHIAPILKEYWNEDLNGYLEPFCGALGVLKHMTDLPTTVYASDYHPDLIQMWKEVQQNKFIYPNSISEEEYNNSKMFKSPNAMKSFIGFGMSFGGRYYGAYSDKYLGEKKENFCKEMINSLERIRPKISEVKFDTKDYSELNPKGKLIYCDPPYKETRYPIKYRREVKKYDEFDNEEFWEVMRNWSKKNVVIISETSAPSDFECIWEKEIGRSASKSKNTKKIEKIRSEKLYKMKSN